MSDSTSLRLAIIKETDWGKEAIPTSINKAQEVRLSSESFGLRRDTQVSDEIRSDRNISELYQTLSYADGDINAEFSAKSHDQLIEGVMYKDFASDGDLVDVSNIAASNVITVGSTDVAKFKVDDVVEITGFYEDAVNRNGLYKVTAVATTTITVEKYGATVNLPTVIAVNKNSILGEVDKRYTLSAPTATTHTVDAVVSSSPTTYAQFITAVGNANTQTDLENAIKDRYTASALTNLDNATFAFKTGEDVGSFKITINFLNAAENLATTYARINETFTITTGTTTVIPDSSVLTTTNDLLATFKTDIAALVASASDFNTGVETAFDTAFTHTSGAVSLTVKTPPAQSVNTPAKFKAAIAKITADDSDTDYEIKVKTKAAKVFDIKWAKQGTENKAIIGINADISGPQNFVVGGLIKAYGSNLGNSWTDKPLVVVSKLTAVPADYTQYATDVLSFFEVRRVDDYPLLLTGTLQATDNVYVTQNPMLRPGGSSDQQSFTVEKFYQDGQIGQRYSGMVVDSADLSLGTGDKINIRMNFSGRGGRIIEGYGKNPHSDLYKSDLASGLIEEGDSNPVTPPGDSDTKIAVTPWLTKKIKDAPTTEIMTASLNVGAVLQDGKSVADIQNLSFAISNNTRPQSAVGISERVGIGSGRIMVSGSASMYFNDNEMYQKFLGNDAFSFSFSIFDDQGNAYSFIMPKCKILNSSIATGGIDQDILMDGEWHSLYDPETDASILISRETV